MDKTVVGLLGAVGALMTVTAGQAATQPASPQAVLQAASYSDLLRPIPNALETLRALDAQAAEAPAAQMEEVQYYPQYGYAPSYYQYRYYHHHHHHHAYYRRWHHHHHHHHHHGFYR